MKYDPSSKISSSTEIHYPPPPLDFDVFLKLWFQVGRQLGRANRASVSERGLKLRRVLDDAIGFNKQLPKEEDEEEIQQDEKVEELKTELSHYENSPSMISVIKEIKKSASQEKKEEEEEEVDSSDYRTRKAVPHPHFKSKKQLFPTEFDREFFRHQDQLEEAKREILGGEKDEEDKVEKEKIEEIKTELGFYEQHPTMIAVVKEMQESLQQQQENSNNKKEENKEKMKNSDQEEEEEMMMENVIDNTIAASEYEVLPRPRFVKKQQYFSTDFQKELFRHSDEVEDARAEILGEKKKKKNKKEEEKKQKDEQKETTTSSPSEQERFLQSLNLDIKKVREIEERMILPQLQKSKLPEEMTLSQEDFALSIAYCSRNLFGIPSSSSSQSSSDPTGTSYHGTRRTFDSDYSKCVAHCVKFHVRYLNALSEAGKKLKQKEEAESKTCKSSSRYSNSILLHHDAHGSNIIVTASSSSSSSLELTPVIIDYGDAHYSFVPEFEICPPFMEYFGTPVFDVLVDGYNSELPPNEEKLDAELLLLTGVQRSMWCCDDTNTRFRTKVRAIVSHFANCL